MNSALPATRRGAFPVHDPYYGLVSNTLMSELSDRLARGDAAGAARLASFARDHVPGFRWSPRDLASRAGAGHGFEAADGR
jgi:hypothetical protein